MANLNTRPNSIALSRQQSTTTDPKTLEQFYNEAIQRLFEKFLNAEERFVWQLAGSLEMYDKIFQNKTLPIGLDAKLYEFFEIFKQIHDLHKN